MPRLAPYGHASCLSAAALRPLSACFRGCRRRGYGRCAPGVAAHLTAAAKRETSPGPKPGPIKCQSTLKRGFVGGRAGGRSLPRDFRNVAWMAMVTQAGVALGLARSVARAPAGPARGRAPQHSRSRSATADHAASVKKPLLLCLLYLIARGVRSNACRRGAAKARGSCLLLCADGALPGVGGRLLHAYGGHHRAQSGDRAAPLPGCHRCSGCVSQPKRRTAPGHCAMLCQGQRLRPGHCKRARADSKCGPER